MKIRVSEGPINGHIRLHAERDDSEQPDVRYLRRKRSEKPHAVRLHSADADAAFEFGNVEVVIRAVEDHVEIVLRIIPPIVSRAA
jgi:hypothetical protein